MSDHWEVPELLMELVTYDTRKGTAWVNVTWGEVDGEPRLRSLSFDMAKPEDLDKQLPPFGQLLDQAVARREAKKRNLVLGPWLGDLEDELVREARQRRRNNRVTPELLREVEQLYLSDGAGQVARELGVSRRTADRYVKAAKDARKDGALG